MTYQQQLNDPRWKKKRGAILKRDGFACANCNITKNLHVHHIKYTGFAWEAPLQDLITLCNHCHKKVHIGVLKIITEVNFDGVTVYPIEGSNPPEFDLYSIGATDEDIPHLGINRYGTHEAPGDYFIIDFRAWAYTYD